MHTRLLFVRRGDSHHKSDGIIGGPKGCCGLTDIGRGQAAPRAPRRAGTRPPATVLRMLRDHDEANATAPSASALG
ncbi:hypothetical protein GCM10010176_104510 [Nonomuraea spiralis]|nr:hypothetical protein GCM10010176_104510 [Nonomuraea spiralis]